MDKKSEKGIFYGWWMLAITSLVTGIGHSYYQYGFSVFFNPVATELGLNRAVTSIASGLGRLEAGFEALLTGWLVDKFGPKWVIFSGVAITALGFFMMYFVNSMWLYFIAWGLLVATGINLGVTIPIDKLLTDWFIKKRGLVMGIKFAFMGVSGALIVPIVTWLVHDFGWRITCVIWGILMILCLFLVVLFIKRKRPEYYGLMPDGVAVNAATSIEEMVSKGRLYAAEVLETEFTLKESTKTLSFWLLLLANGFHIIIQGGVTVHLFPFLTDMGIEPTVAGFMLSLMIIFTIPSRLLGGIIADKINKNHLTMLLASSHLIIALGILVILINPNIVMVYIFLILFGFGSGIFQPVQILIKGRYFGRKSYGSITGLTSLVSAPIGLLAPIYSGWIYDTTGSYSIAFGIFTALMVVSATVILFARPPELITSKS